MSAPKSKTAAIISYLTLVGWIVALVIRDKDCEFTRRHMNQSLIISIVAFVGRAITAVPLVGVLVGRIIDIAVVVFFVMGIVRAAKGSAEPLPVIGNIEILS